VGEEKNMFSAAPPKLATSWPVKAASPGESKKSKSDAISSDCSPDSRRKKATRAGGFGKV
jgi:hypothetical protein